ncbi:MAG: hypothetical protein QHH19_02030 [Candidatus Thermoplasmatota archaeon]|jgi:hypothetical protein|nr:hypothetical protein [Candidatus Thermoplasmatota archaeon]
MEILHILNIVAGLILCVSFLDAVPTLQKFAKWLGSFDTIIGIILIIYVIVAGYWSSLLGIVAIFAGLIMIVGILPAIPAVGKHLEKVAKWLGGFQGFIGIIVLIAGILGVLRII